MASIMAKKGGAPRELIPAGNHIARCIGMIQIGTLNEVIQGKQKKLHKVRISWEIPDELRVFDEAKGEQPMVLSKDYTLSLSDSAHLRKLLESWRGVAFTAEEAQGFDITTVVGAPCMLNIIHETSKSDPTKKYEELTSVTRLPKGIKCPAQINPSKILSYDDFDFEYFETLPDFIKDKMKLTEEYKEMVAAQGAKPAAAAKKPAVEDAEEVVGDDLPF